ncbi:3-ketoacyl-ACP reductase [Clostridia bacterium]|nr:3-ketoacyl-ACP reductase [Clostridia bacterium]
MEQRFIGKTVWVTGAQTSIGTALVQRFQDEGAAVVQSSEALTEESAAAALSEVTTLDVLVTADKVIEPKLLQDCVADDFDAAIDANLTSVFNAMRAAMHKFGKDRGGAIVIVNSIHGEKPNGIAPMFSVACGGLNMLVKEASLDFGRLGVRVNQLRVGAIEGDDSIFYPNELSGIYQTMPTRIARGKPGTPEEAAAAAAFLCSSDASFINGAALNCDGGFLGYYMDADMEQRWSIGFEGKQ